MATPRKKYTRSVSLLRRVQTYPSPKYFTLFVAYATANEMAESEAAAHMIRAFFDAMPEVEKIRIANCRRD